MKTQLTTLVNRNPFVILGISLDATRNDIRHRLEELEMEAQFGGKDAVSREELVFASQMLDDAQQRMECEFFASWESAAAYASVAADHDAALRLVRRLFQRTDDGTPPGGLTILRRWSNLIQDAEIVQVLTQRLRATGIRTSADEWLRDIVADSVLPEVVRRVILDDKSMAVDLADALVALPDEHIGRAAETIAELVGSDIDLNRVQQLTPYHLLRLIPLARRVLEPACRSSFSVYQDRVSTFAHSCMRRAWAEYQGGNRQVAVQIAEALLPLELQDSDRLEIVNDLMQLRP